MKPRAASAARRSTIAALLLVVFVPLLVLWRGALLRGVFFQADLVVYYYPAYTYATRVLRTGLVPLWAPEIEGGQPFHAQWEPTLLYPIDVPFRLLLPPWWSLNSSLIFHYALAAVAMFLYVRRLGVARSAALVSAAIYCANGFMIAHLEHPNLIAGAAWLPLLLLAAEHGLAGQTLAGALGIGAVLGMMLLGGHPDLFLMATLLLGLLALFHPVHGMLRERRWRGALRPAGMLIGGTVLAIALAGAQMLPTLGLAALAWQRHGASVGFQDTWSLKPLQFLVQLLPDLYGRNGQDTYWGVAHYWEECTYVGALALVLALAGLMSRHRLARFYGGVSVLAAWLAMGTNSLAFSLLRQAPGFGTMRLPCRYMFLFDLSVAVLAGMGTHWLSHLERPQERARACWLRGIVTCLLAGSTLWVAVWWLDRDRLFAEVMHRMAPVHLFHHPDLGLLQHRYARQLGLDVALLLGGLSLAAVLLLIATRVPRRRIMIPPLAWAGVVATLFLLGSGYHTVIPARLLADEPFTVREIRHSAPAGPFRVLQWDSIRLHANVAVHRGWWPTDERGYRQYIASLPGNYNLVWGLSSVRQEEWSALPLRHTRWLTSAILARGPQGGIHAVASYLPWWNTAFLISQRPLADPSIALVDADGTRLYQIRDPGERAWIVHKATTEPDEARLVQRLALDPTGLRTSVRFLAPDLTPAVRPSPGPPLRGSPGEGRTAQILHDPVEAGARVGPAVREPRDSVRILVRNSTRMLLEAEAAREGYLVLGESWAPGWHAWVDGEPAPILRANAVHRALRLAPGRHRVEFRYEPSDFRLGLYLSGAALATLLVLTTAGARRRR